MCADGCSDEAGAAHESLDEKIWGKFVVLYDAYGSETYQVGSDFNIKSNRGRKQEDDDWEPGDEQTRFQQKQAAAMQAAAASGEAGRLRTKDSHCHHRGQ